MTNSNRELHVVLGTGPLGLAVMRALVKRGHQVRMVNRSGSAEAPDGVEVVHGDVYQPDNVRQLSEGAAAIYQCAQPGYTEWESKFPPLQTSVIEGVSQSGAKLIVGENLYMYGEVTGPMHERMPYSAHTRKGRVRAAMSRELIDAHESGKIQVAMARGSDFYGPAVLGSALGDRVFLPLIQGKAAQVAGDVDAPHSYTYIDDFGEAMAILGERDEALGRAWHVPNAPTTSTREVIETAARILGVEPKINSMGRFMMRIGGLFIPEARESVEMMYEFEKPFIVDHSDFVKAFGDISTPLETGLRVTLDWYREHGAEAAHA